MSDYHRHNPEFSETIDQMFGVRVARPNEAIVEADDCEADDCECRRRYGPDQDGTFPALAMCPRAKDCAAALKPKEPS